MTSQHLIAWLVIGLISGAVAGRVVMGRGLGCLVSTVVGLAGAFVGGFIWSRLDHPPVVIDGFFDELVVAFLGAALLLVVLRLASPRRWH